MFFTISDDDFVNLAHVARVKRIYTPGNNSVVFKLFSSTGDPLGEYRPEDQQAEAKFVQRLLAA